MTGSIALHSWTASRARRLDRLVAAHHAIAGTGRGRKWLTTEINHALIVRLASEFQGYCRDLHDESINFFTAGVAHDSTATATIIRGSLDSNRRLDGRNASWANVCSDFSRFGVAVAPVLKTSYPVRYPGWIDKLERLNRARNAIAHDDRADMARCEGEQPLTYVTFTKWRSALNGIAAGLDRVVRAYWKDTLGSHPW